MNDMGRRSLLLYGLLLFVIGAFAQSDDDFSIKEGDLLCFKKDVNALVVVDLSGTQYGKENIYEEYRQTERVELPQKILDHALSDFCIQFNYQNKNGLQVDSENPDVAYRMEIHLLQLNQGNAGGVLNIDDKTSGGAKISGMIHLKEISSNNNLCVLEFHEISGESKLSKKARIASAFEELGFRLGKLVK